VTGKRIECFNFGVGAFSLVDMAALAQIVAEEYSPRIIIVGIEALNFTVPSSDPAGHDFANLAWTRYRLGRFTLEGWFYEHSYLYRHLGSVQKLVKMENSPTEMIRFTTEIYNTYRNGFYQLEGEPELDMSQPPDPNSDHRYHVAYFNFHSNYQILSEHLTALDEIIALNSPTTQVVLVEMPVPDTFFYYFDNGRQDYDLFISTVEGEVAGTPVPFWQTTNLQLFSYDLWHNYNHLTEAGAPIFSEWLGKRLGQAVSDGTIRFDDD
jgi:hypothetical protein